LNTSLLYTVLTQHETQATSVHTQHTQTHRYNRCQLYTM